MSPFALVEWPGGASEMDFGVLIELANINLSSYGNDTKCPVSARAFLF